MAGVPTQGFGMDMLVEGSGDVAIVAFTAYGSHGDGFQWRTILNDMSARQIFLMDPSHRWYLGGVSGVADNVDGVVQAIRVAAAHRPIITIGSSMGGFAALLFGALIGARRAIAFAPQTTMIRAHLLPIGDLEWPESVDAIEELGSLYADTAPYVLSSRLEVDLYLDRAASSDAAHARRIASRHVREIHTPGGHECASEVARSGGMRSPLAAAAGLTS